MLNFLTESTKDFKESDTIGAFSLGQGKNDFDSIYESAYNDLLSMNVDPMVDVNTIIKNEPILESFKDALLAPLKEDCDRFAADTTGDSSRYASLYEQTSALFDNCVDDMVTESTRVGQLLPIKAVDFPVLIKQNLALATKDIIQTEVTKTPVIKKHIERQWIVDEATGRRWEYPQCFFNNDYKDIFNAGKGLPIADTWVPLTPAIWNYSIAQNLTTSTDPTKEKITFDLQIVGCQLQEKDFDPNSAATTLVDVPLQMRINMSDNTWLGGQVKNKNGVIVDTIVGTVDFITNTVSVNCINGKVQKIKFAGYLSNENNMRQVSYDITREEREWKIEDGFRVDVPYSLEELEDAKALMDIDLYKLTYGKLSDLLVQMEDSKILEFLDNEYTKYQGVQLDPLGFNSFIRTQTFDCSTQGQTVALPSEYIQKMLKFYVDRFVIDICDTAKMEDMTFVIYGNPRYISLLDPEINWVVKSGDSVG